jgi:hypothetical protein
MCSPLNLVPGTLTALQGRPPDPCFTYEDAELPEVTGLGSGRAGIGAGLHGSKTSAQAPKGPHCPLPLPSHTHALPFLLTLALGGVGRAQGYDRHCYCQCLQVSTP